MGDSIIEIENLRTVFPTRNGLVTAVDDVSFEIERGSMVGLVGETGSGKSVTLRSILGLVPHPGFVARGSVKLDGEDLLKVSQRRIRALRGGTMGLVTQQPWSALNPVYSIGRQFSTILRANGVGNRRSRRQIATDMLRSMELPDPERILAGFAHQLSGGMAQRVVMAMALSLEPQLLFADEPTTALDITVQRRILELLASWSGGSQRTLVIVTHDLGVVAQFCESVLVMEHGLLVESGRTHDVFKNPSHPYTRQLLDGVTRLERFGEPPVAGGGR